MAVELPSFLSEAWNESHLRFLLTNRFEPDDTGPKGVHVFEGLIRFNGELDNIPAVFEMDSEQGVVQKVLLKEDGRWLDIGHHLLNMTPLTISK